MVLNNMLTDQIFHIQSLMIPVSDDYQYQAPKDLTFEQEVAIEKGRRVQAISDMKHFMGNEMGKGKDYTAEATFYCDEHGYDLKKAKEAFLADKQFESS